MPKLRFTVDSALLRELGERLVGKPHIALAELIKNSFDADATEVVVRLKRDSIEVIDNGHGMTLPEFRKFWMRIGSPHKASQRFSRRLKRPLTGSKGVGRLAVQFLARDLQIKTVSDRLRGRELVGKVNWDTAYRAGELTKAEVQYREGVRTTTFPFNSRFGTSIKLRRLNQQWDQNSIRALAREIWWLQPPFRANPRLKTDQQKNFTVRLESEDPRLTNLFQKDVAAILQLWRARISGRLESERLRNGTQRGKVNLAVEFEDGTRLSQSYTIENCALSAAEFEVLVYKMEGRQPYGIKVYEAREYLIKNGSVHIYDAGFHLPYYGPDVDWLGIELDHSHRLSRSKLLPDELQVSHGMNFLPTSSRLLGVVHVDSSFERQRAKAKNKLNEEYLKIQITRDRLVDNRAFNQLRDMVRYAIDYYATREALRVFKQKESEKETEPLRKKFENVDDALENFKDEMPKSVYTELRESVAEALKAADSEAEVAMHQVALLGPLATAGISSLAFQHELKKQFAVIEDIVEKLNEIGIKHPALKRTLHDLREDLVQWIDRARATNALFAPLADSENLKIRKRLPAKRTIEDVKEQVAFLGRGISIDTGDVDSRLLLPRASLVEWSAIFQNVFVNAFHAMLDSNTQVIAVSSQENGKIRQILIQDTGSGVDLTDADLLFEPFERRLKTSPERSALGYGGTGLGLTIVKLVCDNIGCKPAFVEPSKGFKTAFSISWREG
jgi:signal transduction histidine kinase